MTGIPPFLLQELRAVLLQMDVFGSNSRLRPLFLDQRIALWRDLIPEGANRRERVDVVIDFLIERWNLAGENGLVLFLQVLQDQTDPRDSRWHKIAQLISKLKQAVQFSGVPALSPFLPQTNFITQLGQRLVMEQQVHDLSRDFPDFHFLGYRETAIMFDVVGMVVADGLTERQIVSLRQNFFIQVQQMPRQFALRLGVRNPNGVLIFVFEQGCPDHLAEFIPKQSQISHSTRDGAVIVSWIVDLLEKRLVTHNNPVSFFPPVVILPQLAFPNVEDLGLFLQEYGKVPA